MINILTRIFGSRNERLLKQYGQQVRAVNALEPTISALSDGDWVAVNTILEENVVRDVIPRLKAANAQGIVEYPLNKVVM